MKDHMSITEFLAQYGTEEQAVAFSEKERWGGQLTCPHCHSVNVARVSHKMPYRCRTCRKLFSIKTGTFMEKSNIPVKSWLLATYLLTSKPKGISSIQLAKECGITQKSAWHMAHRIRKACVQAGKLSGEVEADETFIGGKEMNKHSNKKLRAGRGTVGKVAVFGARERSGGTRAAVIDGTGHQQIGAVVRRHVEKGARLYTDEASGYAPLRREYRHEAVKHHKGEYVRGAAHTNSVESLWALLKRGYHGTYHKWSRKHLHRYINEFVFRANARGEAGDKVLRKILSHMVGSKLPYKELTK